MERRKFLRGMAGILAAGAAPAIITNAMKIVVPKTDLQRGYSWPLTMEVDPRRNQIKVYIDELAAKRQDAKEVLLANGQMHSRIHRVDTSRGIQVYEIPLKPMHAVDMRTWKPTPIPGGPRIFDLS